MGGSETFSGDTLLAIYDAVRHVPRTTVSSSIRDHPVLHPAHSTHGGPLCTDETDTGSTGVKL